MCDYSVNVQTKIHRKEFKKFVFIFFFYFVIQNASGKDILRQDASYFASPSHGHNTFSSFDDCFIHPPCASVFAMWNFLCFRIMVFFSCLHFTDTSFLPYFCCVQSCFCFSSLLCCYRAVYFISEKKTHKKIEKQRPILHRKYVLCPFAYNAIKNKYIHRIKQKTLLLQHNSLLLYSIHSLFLPPLLYLLSPYAHTHSNQSARALSSNFLFRTNGNPL